VTGLNFTEFLWGVKGSDVNKDLTLKAKAKDSTFKAKDSSFKAKDRTFEGLNRELDL